MDRTISILSVLLGILGCCLSQDCHPVSVCDSKVEMVPSCTGGPSAAVECLKKLNIDCHGKESATEALTRAKFELRVVCDNSDVKNLYAQNPDCWKDKELHVGCITPLSNDNITFKDISDAEKKNKCKSLRGTVDSCKGTRPEKCKDVDSKLLEASLKAMTCDASSLAVQTTAVAIYVVLLLITVAYSKFRD